MSNSFGTIAMFLVVSFRKMKRFGVSRARLVRAGMVALETDLNDHSKLCAIKVHVPSYYRYPVLDRTSGTKLSFRLMDSHQTIPNLPFVSGAQRLLRLLRPKDSLLQCLPFLTAETRSQAAKNSQIESEPLDLPREAQVILANQANPRTKNIPAFSIFDFNHEVHKLPLRTFPAKAKLTVSQLRFWIMKGLENVETSKISDTRNLSIIGKLLQILVLYIEPMILLIVRPLLETATDNVEDVHIAQRCNKEYEFLLQTAQHQMQTSVLRELKRSLRADWMELISVLESSNRQLITKYYNRELEKPSARFHAILQLSFRLIGCEHELVKFEQSTTADWRLDKENPTAGHPLYPPQNKLLSIEQLPRFQVHRYSSKLVISDHGVKTDTNKTPPATATVKFELNELVTKDCHSNNRFLAIVEPYKSKIWFTPIKDILILLEASHLAQDRQLEVESSALFQLYEVPDPILLPHPSENQQTYWRLLQQGLVQFYLPGHAWQCGFDDRALYYRNNSHCQMLYIDLSSVGEPQSVSRFDLTTGLFDQRKPRITNHKFWHLSLITKSSDKFFLSFLEASDFSTTETSAISIHLAQIITKDSGIEVLNYSAISLTRAELAMLDYEHRLSQGSRGWLQWMLKANLYFSLAYLTTEKYCIWMHVFYNNRFLPVGRSRQTVPGLTQPGMSVNFVQVCASMAFIEKREFLRSNKISYQLFTLKLDW